MQTVSEIFFTDGFVLRAHSRTMKNHNKPFTHFDMTTTHLADTVTHYHTPRTHDSTEAERRHDMPGGSLILEDQTSGLIVGAHGLQHEFQNPEDERFFHDQLIASLVNTGHYSGARGASDVMRRRWYLPELASDEGDGWRETREGLMYKVHAEMSHAVTLAQQLELAHKRELKAESLRRQLGRATGSAAIALACYDLGDAPEDMSAYDIQALVRLRALDTIQQSRQFTPFETYGSIAQFARDDSPVAINFMRTAPRSDEAAAVFAQAQEDFGLAS